MTESEVRKFPKHWLAVGYELNDPKTDTADGFWKFYPLVSAGQVIHWLTQEVDPGDRIMERRIYYSSIQIFEDMQGRYKDDPRFVKSATSLLGYLARLKG